MLKQNLFYYLILVFSLFVIFASLWIGYNYGDINFTAIIFHIRFPYGVNSSFVISFLLVVVLPSLTIPLVVLFKKTQIWLYVVLFMLCAIIFVVGDRDVYMLYRLSILAFSSNGREILEYINGFQLFEYIAGVAVFLLVIFLCAKYAYSKFHSKRYATITLVSLICGISIVALQRNFDIMRFVFRDYSNFYEENYISLATPTLPKKPQNLVVIFVESLESTYSSQNIPKNIAMGGAG